MCLTVAASVSTDEPAISTVCSGVDADILEQGKQPEKQLTFSLCLASLVLTSPHEVKDDDVKNTHQRAMDVAHCDHQVRDLLFTIVVADSRSV